METRCPEGAGQRQRSWLGAKHDSPVPVREVARRQQKQTGNSSRTDRNRNRNRNRNRQRIITGRKKKPCTGQTKHLTGMQKIRRTTERTIRSSVIF
ncbi:hypothetical protein D3S17_20265 [Salmonella enterica]|nr:hypothetical protein [Salmonella enterica]